MDRLAGMIQLTAEAAKLKGGPGGRDEVVSEEQQQQRLMESQLLLRTHGSQMRAAALLIDRGELDLAQELLDALETDVVGVWNRAAKSTGAELL